MARSSGLVLLLAAWPLAFVNLGTGSRKSWLPRRAKPEKQPHHGNVDGNFYVDHTCIDCDTCRWMAPQTFGRTARSGPGQSVVHQQPSDTQEVDRALEAMISCPTGSIRTRAPVARAKEVLDSFPLAVDVDGLPHVFHLGYHSKKSFGAASYFVAGRAGGALNVMFDSPRFSSKLASLLEEAGGIDFMVLSHKDDVADHIQWKKRFPEMRRVMHVADVRGPDAWPYIDMTEIEEQLAGQGPWSLADGLSVIHTPGHSEGSITLLAAEGFTGGEGVAFTGDHLALNGRLGRLDGFARYSEDHDLQADSMLKLADEDFLWILPGHGRRVHFASATERRQRLQKAAEEYREDPKGEGAPGALFKVLEVAPR
ncbi:unnamed protein product [Effrenium voratum]|uniref:Metallo-beta-lactamase domain-containing protein n=1 Tax=Effrenium voratum TaxID=2562239 RepID=A0AA36MTG3_9DINO|nr:unnamed protein product [Effrenium voratum]